MLHQLGVSVPPVNSERQREAAALRALMANRNQAALAREHKFPGGASMLSQHMSGNRPISLRSGVAYAKALGISLDAFSPRLAREANATSVVAHPLILDAYTVPTLTWEQLMSSQKDLPPEFKATMQDDALPSTPRGTVLIFSTTDTPAFGNGVLVQVRDQLHIRRYAQHAEGWCAQAERAGYATFLPSDGAQVLATVIGRYDRQV